MNKYKKVAATIRCGARWVEWGDLYHDVCYRDSRHGGDARSAFSCRGKSQIKSTVNRLIPVQQSDPFEPL